MVILMLHWKSCIGLIGTIVLFCIGARHRGESVWWRCGRERWAWELTMTGSYASGCLLSHIAVKRTYGDGLSIP